MLKRKQDPHIGHHLQLAGPRARLEFANGMQTRCMSMWNWHLTGRDVQSQNKGMKILDVWITEHARHTVPSLLELACCCFTWVAVQVPMAALALYNLYIAGATQSFGGFRWQLFACFFMFIGMWNHVPVVVSTIDPLALSIRPSDSVCFGKVNPIQTPEISDFQVGNQSCLNHLTHRPKHINWLFVFHNFWLKLLEMVWFVHFVLRRSHGCTHRLEARPEEASWCSWAAVSDIQVARDPLVSWVANGVGSFRGSCNQLARVAISMTELTDMLISVGIAIIIFDGLYHPFVVISGMVYYCYTNIMFEVVFTVQWTASMS